VDIAFGEDGQCVRSHVEVGQNLDPGLVQTHLLLTVVKPAKVTPQKNLRVIQMDVQVC